MTLSAAARETKSAQAYQLSLQGLSAPQIGKRLGVSEKTIDRYLAKERDAVRVRRQQQAPDADLNEFLGAQKAIAAEMWTWIQNGTAVALGQVDPSDCANVASQAWERIAKALGLYTTKIEHGASHELLMQLLGQPVTVEVPETPDNTEFEGASGNG